MPAVAPERSGFLSRAGASGSLYLPWALPRIVPAHQSVPDALEDGRGWCAAGEPGDACSKDASKSFARGRRNNATADRSAGRRRGGGCAGRRSSDTGRQKRAKKNATGKVGATASAPETGNQPSRQSRSQRRRG